MLENLTPPGRPAPCKVTSIREGLDPDDQKLLDTFLGDCVNWSPNALSVALRRQGILMSGDTIRRYRVRNDLC